MRAGRMIIANYSSKAVDLLLPHLETGLFDEAWRIRMSSLQLTADLLFRLSGISGKNEVEDEGVDEDMEHLAANNSVQRALVEALGQERRDRILASIYIVRQDPNIPVRQAAIHTWKALVHNTPRTAREVLPTMLDILIKSLASNGDENREMAARTLGELVKKLGEKILRETVPILRMRGATSEDPKTRSGVCYAVTEVLANSTKGQLEDHEDAIIAVVRHALVDESQSVRHAAAQAFDATQTYIGPRAIDETIPTLLEALSDTSGGTSETALAALREVMRARSDVVFPVLVPTLIAQPITSFNARALAVLVRVAGTALNRRLSKHPHSAFQGAGRGEGRDDPRRSADRGRSAAGLGFGRRWSPPDDAAAAGMGRIQLVATAACRRMQLLQGVLPGQEAVCRRIGLLGGLAAQARFASG